MLAHSTGMVAAALLELAAAGDPRVKGLSEARATYFGDTIEAVTDNVADQAALTVLVDREGGTEPKVEHCIKLGKGGAGAWQLNPAQHSMVIACGHPIVQAYGAIDALYDKGWATYRRGALQGYLGATDARHPEVQVRLTLFTLTAERLRCRCSF